MISVFCRQLLTYSKNRMELPLPEWRYLFIPVRIKKTLLTKIITDNKGVARFELSDEMKPGTDGWNVGFQFRI